MTIEDFIRKIPKAELHLHLEGTLEPEMLFALAERNGVRLPFTSPEAVRAAYDFRNLQEFLDLYYQGCRTLLKPEDFCDLASAYFRKCREENILHAEVFFDPQAHTSRGVPIQHVFDGFLAAAADAEKAFGLSIGFIMCFLRHLDASEGFTLLEQAAPYLQRLAGIGLDSSEVGNPPQKYAAVFAEAKRLGLRRVAHAGEEGPPQYVWDALKLLEVERIDHGVRAVEDARLMSHLVERQIALTVCPLSNIKLCVFKSMAEHSFEALYRAGVKVTINSDDPAYFGGYVTENYLACARTFGFSAADIHKISRNAFEASFLPPEKKRALIDRVDAEARRLSAGA